MAYQPAAINTDITVLASAARTATTSSADITNRHAGAVIFHLNVTIASGTGGLQLQMEMKDPVSGVYSPVATLPPAVMGVSTNIYVYALGASGSAGNVRQSNSVPVPLTFRVKVTHGDASSYTYSVSAQLITRA